MICPVICMVAGPSTLKHIAGPSFLESKLKLFNDHCLTDEYDNEQIVTHGVEPLTPTRIFI